MPHSILLLPSFLERINTDLTAFREIRMEDFGDHGAYVEVMASSLSFIRSHS